MSLANKFLRYFYRVHFGENKKHNLVPSQLPQTLVVCTGTWSSGTTLIGGWGGVGGGGQGGWGRPFGHFTELSLWNVICKWVTQNLCTHIGSLRQVAWYENNMSLLLLDFDQIPAGALTHAASWENPAGFAPFFEQKIQGLFKDFQGHISHFSFLLLWSSRDHWLKVTKLCLAWLESLLSFYTKHRN